MRLRTAGLAFAVQRRQEPSDGTSPGLPGLSRSGFDARPELGVQLQDVLLDPFAEGLMQTQEDFPAETFRLVTLLELLEKRSELFVGFFVFYERGTGNAPCSPLQD